MNYNEYLKCYVEDCIDENGCILPQQIAELQDKLHRRNMQIKELKRELAKYMQVSIGVKEISPADYINR